MRVQELNDSEKEVALRRLLTYMSPHQIVTAIMRSLGSQTQVDVARTLLKGKLVRRRTSPCKTCGQRPFVACFNCQEDDKKKAPIEVLSEKTEYFSLTDHLFGDKESK